MDILSIVGLTLAIGAVLIGQLLEGGHVSSLMNGPAFVIVFGGTIGAAMLQSSLTTFLDALKCAVWVFVPQIPRFDEAIETIVGWSEMARSEGLLALEELIEGEQDDFRRLGLQLLVDGNDGDQIRQVLEQQAIVDESRYMDAAKVYEAMGGYAPTVGILGAVLGLIHVMENLADPSALGSGIAAAFVATVYGVGAANLLFLPLGNKIKSVTEKKAAVSFMYVEGLVGISMGDNPRNLRLKLKAHSS
jgi:chemotaxis protein MotA